MLLRQHLVLDKTPCIIILIMLLTLAFASPGWAYTETINIAQGGTGDGSQCNNAHPPSWFNNSSNWSTRVSADGKIGPDDLVIICNDGGDITTTLSTQGDGTGGNVITIQGEPGVSVILNGGGGAGGSVFVLQHDYIIVDG